MADTKEILNCPACDKVMKKIYVSENNINVDICTEGCGGIFFDNREFEKFDEKHENAEEILSKLSKKEFVKVNEKELRICPACGASMTKVGAAGGEVEIDVCYSCGGKFLDYGELEKIREYENDTEKLDNIMDGIFESVHEDMVKPVKSSPRRKFFEDFVKNRIAGTQNKDDLFRGK